MKEIIAVIKRELNRIVSSKIYIFFLFVFPVIIFSFLLYIYNTGVLRNIPVAVCDKDNSELSRTFLNFVESTGSMKINKYTASETELKNEIYDGNISAAFVIPENFESDIKSGKGSSVIVYNNTTNLVIGNTVLKDASTFIKTFSAGVLLKKIRSKGIYENEAMNILNPIKIDSHPLYNPNYNYLNYLAPGLVPVILQMIIMLLAAILISSEFSSNTFKNLMQTANNKVYAVILGKSLPYLFLFSITFLLILGIIFPFFKVEINGSILNSILLFIIFVASSFFYGLSFSCITKNYLQTTEISLFFNTPAFIFSGFVYPLWAMPRPHFLFAQLMPFTHFIDAFLKVGFMDAELKYALPEIFRLSLFILIPIIFVYAFLLYHKYLIKNNKEENYLLEGDVADV